MKRIISLTLVALVSGFGIIGCADEPEKKPVGPVSDTSKIPWNSPVADKVKGSSECCRKTNTAAERPSVAVIGGAAFQ